MILVCSYCNKELLLINENEILNQKNINNFILLCKNCYNEACEVKRNDK